MRRLPLAAVLLFLAGVAHAQKLGPVDWIFLVDTSKSMRGVGGTKDIWTDVTVCIASFIRETGGEDTVAIYSFDRDVRKIEAVSRDDLFDALLRLRAEGDRTHLGAAIAKGLDHASSLRPGPDPTRSRAVVLFTDGREDVRGIESPISIDANLERVGDTFVFFVSMGEHEQQLDTFAAATERTTVLKAPTAEAIRSVMREIRAKIPVKPPPPSPKPKIVQRPAPPPPVEKPFPILKLMIGIALLALAAFFIVQQQRKKTRLEGELEILRPSSAPDAAFVGLPTLQASEIALSSILPPESLAGSDARLFVRRKSGRKKVWIAAQSGSLRVNDIETPMSELFDADTIEIGNAKLRFNRVGDERPLESNQEGDL